MKIIIILNNICMNFDYALFEANYTNKDHFIKDNLLIVVLNLNDR